MTAGEFVKEVRRRMKQKQTNPMGDQIQFDEKVSAHLCCAQCGQQVVSGADHECPKEEGEDNGTE